jgi:hypothetical protein
MPTKYKNIIVSTHFSNIISQLCGVTKEFIVRKFPDNYFKDIFMTTEDFAVRLGKMRNRRGLNSPIKLPYPRLAINPRYNVEESILRGQDHYDWMNKAAREGRLTPQALERLYIKIFQDIPDDQHECSIYTLPKNNKITFEVSMAVESELILFDTLNYIREAFIFNKYFYINDVWMYSIIPNEIIYPIADFYGIDLSDRIQRMEFCDLLQKRSGKIIEDIMVPARAEQFFVFKYRNNILFKLEIPSGDKQKKSMITEKGEIKFQGELQTSSPTNFAAVIYDYGQRQINIPIESSINSGIRVFDKVLSAPPSIIEDKMLIAWKGFFAEGSGRYNSILEATIDNIPMQEIGNMEYIACLDYCDNINDYSLMDIKIFSNDDKGFIKTTDYSINWKQKKIQLLNYVHGSVYYIAVYMDRREMKNALEAMSYVRHTSTIPSVIPDTM